MSFGWHITGKGGVDFIKKYDINYQGCGLAANSDGSTEGIHRLNDIRNAFIEVPYKKEFPLAAQDAITVVKVLLQENLDSLIVHHCETCCCKPIVPTWDIDQIKRFLSIPIEEVISAEGGW